jgi:hypothetical protein
MDLWLRGGSVILRLRNKRIALRRSVRTILRLGIRVPLILLVRLRMRRLRVLFGTRRRSLMLSRSGLSRRVMVLTERVRGGKRQDPERGSQCHAAPRVRPAYAFHLLPNPNRFWS